MCKARRQSQPQSLTDNVDAHCEMSESLTVRRSALQRLTLPAMVCGTAFSSGQPFRSRESRAASVLSAKMIALTLGRGRGSLCFFDPHTCRHRPLQPQPSLPQKLSTLVPDLLQCKAFHRRRMIFSAAVRWESRLNRHQPPPLGLPKQPSAMKT